jgi:hypothetical protein
MYIEGRPIYFTRPRIYFTRPPACSQMTASLFAPPRDLFHSTLQLWQEIGKATKAKHAVIGPTRPQTTVISAYEYENLALSGTISSIVWPAFKRPELNTSSSIR